jgi:hypothetical protein
VFGSVAAMAPALPVEDAAGAGSKGGADGAVSAAP